MPHLVTALATLLVAWLWFGRGARDSLVTYIPATVTRVVVVATPTAHPEAPAAVGDLSAQTDALWSAVYISRAQLHVADIAAAVAQNDVVRVEQLLLSLDDTLAMAEAVAPTAARDLIAQLRLDTVAIRQDVPTRADGLAGRVERLRQALLPLIGAPLQGR